VTTPLPKPDVVIFDGGNVLVAWDPRHLYRKLLPDDDAVERFLSEVATTDWNNEQDRGRSWREAISLLVERHPGHADLIRAYDERWQEMISGPIEGSVDILAELLAMRTPLYAITNFSRKKWRESLGRFAFLGWFCDVVVSAHEGVMKPDPAIYRILLERNGLDAARCVFIDDSPANVASARDVGLQALRFTTPSALADDLRTLGFRLPERRTP
jgi:2-haloacid dehalogenase